MKGGGAQHAPPQGKQGSVPRNLLACASLGCPFRVHSRPELGGYCCIACSQSRGGEHGPRCERVPAQRRDPRADEGWVPMGGEKLAGLELQDAQRELARLEIDGHDGVERELMLGGALCTGCFLEVPLDHGAAAWDRQLIPLFYREVVHITKRARSAELPVLLCLQGGPGFPANRPDNANDGWLGRALQGYRVLLVDQRGTGRSTPVTAQTLRGKTAEEQAAYLVHFRTDSVVDDFEIIRKALGVQKVSVLGESSGGAVALVYLSRHRMSLDRIYITGGLPPVLARGPDEVYRGLYHRVVMQNQRYYARYPGDVSEVRDIVSYLENTGGVALPGGGRLTARRFLSLGLLLDGGLGLEQMHWLVADAFVEVDGEQELDFRFLMHSEVSFFDTNPLYWLLHEAMYCGGSDSGASCWSAQRVLEEPPFRQIFDHHAALQDPTSPPVFFTGEMVYPWFAEDFATLGELRGAAELLAEKTDWPQLYDAEALRGTRVPVAVVVGSEDATEPDRDTSVTSAHLGSRCKVWNSEEFQYTGLCGSVMDVLIDLAGGGLPPSRSAGLAPPPLLKDGGPARRLTGEGLADLQLTEARRLLWPAPDWRNLYLASRQRTRDGAEEELLPGGVVSISNCVGAPLDHFEDPDGPAILVFFREVVLASHADRRSSMPVLIFLVGGPGFPAPKPSATTDGWLISALQGHRVLMLEQRGTGRSASITPQTLQGMSPHDQAEYLTHFRADSIVEDCEAVRRSLGVERVSLLGESFGGFCALTYLSRYPERLAAVYFTGGLAPVLASGPDEVYRCTYQRVITRNKRYYERYPGDIMKVREIFAYLEEKKAVSLPKGGRLTSRRFLSLGLILGSEYGLEAMHHLVESAFVLLDGGIRELDFRFLAQVGDMQSFETNPIYWMLHEAIYCGPKSGASRWSAWRVLAEPLFRVLFDHRAVLADPDQRRPIYFTGEMVYPWFAEDFAALGPLEEAAKLLAEKDNWPALYDTKVLQNTRVPCAAHVDSEDIYVEVKLSEATASLLGSNCRLWISDEFQHSGLTDSQGGVMDKLMEMAQAIASQSRRNK